MSNKRKRLHIKQAQIHTNPVVKTEPKTEKKADVKSVKEAVKTQKTEAKKIGVETVKSKETKIEQKAEIQKPKIEVEVPKVEINHNEKIKRNLTLSVKNDSDLEKLSDKIGLTKSKIVDIMLSKMFRNEINNEFDLYELEIKVKQ